MAAPVVPRKLAANRAEEQKNDVGQRRGFAFDVDVNATGNDKSEPMSAMKLMYRARCATRALMPANPANNSRA